MTINNRPTALRRTVCTLPVAFPTKALFQGCHNFLWVRRAIRSDRLALLEENRPDKEFPLRIQPGQMEEAATKFLVPRSL